jgi:microsomal dipeptidase-like Zn-dependent dipeptidase
MTVPGFRRAVFARPLVVLLVTFLFQPALLRANDVTPPVAPPPRPPILGFVDTHLHQFSNLGFGGLEVFGSPMDPTLDASSPISSARARALPDSDFIYVPLSDAPDYRAIGGDPIGYDTVACPSGSGTCAKITVHGSGGSSDLLNQLIPHGSSGHGVMGYPDMNGWPAFDVHTAQQAYWEWLQRAHDNGLKLMVMLAVNNALLCQLAVHRASFGCGDDGAVNRQIQGAKDLEDYIDARAGGAGQGFYRIVYSADEARTAIQAGKLAVVLGTEVDTAWGCKPDAIFCTDGFITAQVEAYHAAGIRVVYPVHLIDNKFGGSAVYNGLFELNNFLINATWYDMDGCDAPVEWRSDIREVISDAKDGVSVAIGLLFALGPAAILGALPVLDAAATVMLASLPIFATMLPVLAPLFGDVAALLLIPGLGGAILAIVAGVLIMQAPGEVGSATQGNCNMRGLTADGTTLINALMDHQMIIDIDHTDAVMFDDIMDIAEARHYPGIVTGHTGLNGSSLTRAELGGAFKASDSSRSEAAKTDAQVHRVIDAGGFVAIGLNQGGRKNTRDFSSSDLVAFDCGRSSQAFAQVYLYATRQLNMTAVGIGSDINGFAGSIAPRFGSKACSGDMAGGYDPNSSSGRLDYATATNYLGAPLSQYSFGNRTWDFNVHGFAHVGMYPDFLADLKAIGLSDEELAPLLGGVEGYVRMWERVDDNEAPTVRCGTVGEDWHAADVTVPCLSFDFGWGLANPTDANFSLSTTVPDGTETGNAFTGTHAPICDDEPNCTGVIPAIGGINVDKKDPTVIVTTPEAGTPTYILNAVVPADYGCTDGGSGVASCSAPVLSTFPIDTTSVGTFAFTVTGIDNVGHTVVVPHPYNISFAICAQYDQTAAHRAGATVPIKIRLCDASGANVSAESIVVTATGVIQLSTSAPGPLNDSGNANPDNAFRFVSSGEYLFNLKTTGLATGTYALTFTATGDPNPHQVQFQIR